MELPDYKNPPLNEVAMGVSFDIMKQLKMPHIGAFWKKIKEEYPQCEQMPPLGGQEVPPMSDQFQLPFPRTWFISEDNTHLIQVQNGFFFLNWRKRADKTEYPRYEALFENFRKKLGEFAEFVQEEGIDELKVKECHLTYTNHIYFNELLQSEEDLANIFPDFCWRKKEQRFLKAPRPEMWRLTFSLPGDYGYLRTEVRYAKSKVKKVPLFILELEARGLGQINNLEEIRKWFDVSHEHIVRAFADLTSDEAQKELWNRT